MAMGKKEFIALADIAREIKPAMPRSDVQEHDWGRLEQWEEMLAALADFCQSQNPNFERDRWLGYVKGENGPNGGKLK